MSDAAPLRSLNDALADLKDVQSRLESARDHLTRADRPGLAGDVRSLEMELKVTIGDLDSLLERLEEEQDHGPGGKHG